MYSFFFVRECKLKLWKTASKFISHHRQMNTLCMFSNLLRSNSLNGAKNEWDGALCNPVFFFFFSWAWAKKRQQQEVFFTAAQEMKKKTQFGFVRCIFRFFYFIFLLAWPVGPDSSNGFCIEKPIFLSYLFVPFCLLLMPICVLPFLVLGQGLRKTLENALQFLFLPPQI